MTLNHRLILPLVLGLILLLALSLRLYKISEPLADWHSWRQADTASVTREYFKGEVDLLHPRYHDLSDIQSGIDNPQGYRMVEFPLINAVTAWLYQLSHPIHDLELHVFSRLVSILFSLGTVVTMYLLVKHLFSSTVGLLTGIVLAVLPFFVFYSRSVLPEIPLLFFSTLSLYWGILCINSKPRIQNRYLLGSSLAAAISLLIKPTSGFILFPLIVYGISVHNFGWIFKTKHIIASSFVVIPLLSWRYWIAQFPEGIPAYHWLLNFDDIRFSGAFFYWLFADRIGRLILGYWGLVLLGAGIISLDKSSQIPSPLSWREYATDRIFKFFSRIYSQKPSDSQIKPVNAFIYSWILSMLAYLIIFAGGNVRHDYYQIMLVPLLSLLIALGLYQLIIKRSIISVSLGLVSFIFMLMFSWYHVRDYYSIHNWAMVEAGRVVDQITPADALVIAPYNGDTAFLYQTNRRGWPIGHNIQDKIEKGATHYVTTNFDDEAKELIEQYQVIHQTDDYIIIKLVGVN